MPFSWKGPALVGYPLALRKEKEVGEQKQTSSMSQS